MFRRARQLMALSVVALIAAIGIVSANAGTTREHGSAIPKTLTVTEAADLSVLDPQTGGNVEYLPANVSEGLTEPVFAKGGDVVAGPVLAVSWSLKSPTVWQFNLRQHVTFTNGEPFNAAAVVYSWKRLIDPKTASGWASDFQTISNVQAVNAHVVNFITSVTTPDLPLALGNLQIVPPAYAATGGMLKKPVGTGPYMVVSANQDVLKLRANPNYWDKTIKLAATNVTFDYQPEESQRLAALQAGETDIAADLSPPSAKQAPVVKAFPNTDVLTLDLNGTSGVFRNPLMREAVAVGTDTESIRKALFGNYSQNPKCQFAPPGTFGYNPHFAQPTVDVTRAKALIKQAGYSGQTITIVDAAGHYTEGDEFMEAVAEQWTNLGLNVNFKSLPTASWQTIIHGTKNSDGTYSHTVDGFLIGLGSDDLRGITPILKAVGPTANLSMFPQDQFPKLAQMLIKAQSEVTDKGRSIAVSAVSQLICSSHAVLFLANDYRIWGMKKGVAFWTKPNGTLALFKRS